ncbi:MAG: hypothetical protein IJX77_08490 [Ruminococcus sp.]|nr:hypothetical protein [Ruminococcus sp.]
MNVKEKLTKNYENMPDEREVQNNDKALAGAAVVSMLFNIVLMVYGAFSDDLKLAVVGMAQLIFMGLVVAVIKHRKNDFDIPKTISGRKINTELTKEGKRSRIGYYLLEALGCAIGFGVIDVLLSQEITAVAIAVTFAVSYIVSFIFDYLHIEHKVKKYNEFMVNIVDDDDCE